jgi:hypothetical protein
VGAPFKKGSREDPIAVAAALAAAGLCVGAHVMAKAARDTLFLSTFQVELLPYFFIGTGVLSGFAVGAYTRLLAAFSPQRVVPSLAGVSALMLGLLWLGERHAGAWVVAILYAWTSVSNTLLISGYWTVYNERFDPRTARKLFGIVGMATTIGGVVGGVGSHSLLRVVEPESLLLSLAGVDILAALAVLRLASSTPQRRALTPVAVGEPLPERVQPNGGLLRGIQDLIATPYLRNIALFAGGLTIAGTLCDYVLKDAAYRAISGKRELGEFFALFHGAVSAVTLGVQVLICGPLVAKKGIYSALLALPLWLFLGAAAVVSMPLLWLATVLRGGENAVRNSFYRAAYELLFLPVPTEKKRLAKPIIDALLERVADAVGAGVILVLVTLIAFPAKSLLWVVFGIALLSVAIAQRVRQGYVETLSTSLVQHAVELDEVAHAAGGDATARQTIRSTLLETGEDLRRSMLKSHAGLSLMRTLSVDVPEASRESTRRSPTSHGRTTAPGSRRGADPVVGLVAQMLGPEVEVARAAIKAWDGRDRRPVPFMVRLLARDDLYKDVIASLSKASDRIVGSLADHLADPDELFAVRRRVPRVIGACRSDEAVAALVGGLGDRRFEVRYQCAAALDRIRARSGQVPDPRRIWKAIRDEVKKSKPMWEAQRLLEEPEAMDDPLLARAVTRRGAHSLRHVFRLVGLVQGDPKALEVSYEAVHAGEAHFRAVGLEYLENILPPDVRDALWPLIGDDDEPKLPDQPRQSMNEAMQALLASSTSLRPPDAGAGLTGVVEVSSGNLEAPPLGSLKDLLAMSLSTSSAPPPPAPPSGSEGDGGEEKRPEGDNAGDRRA